jgi:small subunit ribosomal protein S1
MVKAQVLEADRERRRLRLGIKQLVPTSIDEYIAEHKPGDSVSGRVVDVSATRAQVELGEGVMAQCKLAERKTSEASASASKTDISSLSAMLAQKWKSGPAVSTAPSAVHEGEIRSFRITNLDPAQKRIELELA